MALPDQAIVEFMSKDDMLLLADYFDSTQDAVHAHAIRVRKYHPTLCLRIADGKYRSFGSHRLYEDPCWSDFVNSTDPQFMYCSVQHLLTYAGFLAFEEDEGEDPDLDGLL